MLSIMILQDMDGPKKVIVSGLNPLTLIHYNRLFLMHADDNDEFQLIKDDDDLDEEDFG